MTFHYNVHGIHPFACEGEGILITGERSSAFICTDKAGTAAQNVESFVSKLKAWLSENGHKEAMADTVFLYYPKEISICGKGYFLPIKDDDSLGVPMSRGQVIRLLGCKEEDLPSAN